MFDLSNKLHRNKLLIEQVEKGLKRKMNSHIFVEAKPKN